MKMHKTKSWKHVKTGIDGNCELFGVNIFDYQWKSTGERITVKDPVYQQEYVISVFEVTINDTIHVFAAGEFSNGVWGFYLYSY
jgi:hypothetical protein